MKLKHDVSILYNSRILQGYYGVGITEIRAIGSRLATSCRAYVENDAKRL